MQPYWSILMWQPILSIYKRKSEVSDWDLDLNQQLCTKHLTREVVADFCLLFEKTLGGGGGQGGVECWWGWGRREGKGRLQGNRASRPAGNLKWPASPTWTSYKDTNTERNTDKDTDTDVQSKMAWQSDLDLCGNMGENEEVLYVEHNLSDF